MGQLQQFGVGGKSAFINSEALNTGHGNSFSDCIKHLSLCSEVDKSACSKSQSPQK